MKLKLTITERILLISILNAFKGRLDIMAKVLDDLKAIGVDEKEAQEIGLKESEGRVEWNPAKTKEKEIEISKDSIDYVVNYIKEKDENNEFSLAEKDIIQLREKLK